MLILSLVHVDSQFMSQIHSLCHIGSHFMSH